MDLKDYLVLSLSFGALIFSYINTKMQIKANREQMKADNLIKLRSEWIQRFSKLIINIKAKFSTILEYAMHLDYKDENIEWEKINATKKEIYFLQNELLLFVTLEGESLTFTSHDKETPVILINEMYRLFIDFFNTRFNNYKEQQESISELQKSLALFNTHAVQLIQDQTEKLTK